MHKSHLRPLIDGHRCPKWISRTAITRFGKPWKFIPSRLTPERLLPISRACAIPHWGLFPRRNSSPIAEESALIVKLGAYILEQACPMPLARNV